ncbi:MAG: CBS domain-containing protein [Halobacteriota archaeon]|uniref:CBS domain-containing protein n=1 Tax=Natronomonas sp. TaxID=2184060 RepID=UPI0039752426
MIDRRIEDIDPEFAPVVRPETPVTDIAELLCDPDASAVVVVENEAIAGIVTGSDIVAMVANTERYPTARSIMSSSVVTVSPSTTLVEAAELMRSEGVRHLAIDDGTYRGVVSTTTLAPYLSRHRLDIEWHGEPSTVTADGGGTLVAEN